MKHIYNQLERLGQLLRNNIRQIASEYELLPIQTEALHYLSRCNQYSNTPLAVADYLGQTKGTVSQTLKVLQRKGFIHKQPDPEDKRVIHLLLTEKGFALLEHFAPTQQFQQLVVYLEPQQIQEIQRNLELLLEAQIQLNQHKPFGLCKTCRFNQSDDKGFFCNLLNQPLNTKEIELICKEHQYPQPNYHA
ncbi:MAG: winged helix-turn-helix transcriptional regulator [Kangiellaceae bacterium]|nr:winged helix-turn-helix transcriptional regulator [Kangiellaceae bacterium]